MNKYLCETEYIDYGNILVKEKVNELRDESMNSMDYMKQAYLFVRDEITHTWDIKETVVSKKASDVLRNKTVICWTKSCLLAANHPDLDKRLCTILEESNNILQIHTDFEM